ncbi:SDR family oxidoreductase [Parapusillimonas sp. JC17]|uniref:SDR family oxidoreductase n=1 Tax=Parapusillimonas sp. JC17 TaxID=3445768 RepID=UPI003F9F3AD9
MDLQLHGKRALVCGASKGLGRACAMSLAREGVDVILVARGGAQLQEAADAISTATGAKITFVAADLTTAGGREAALQAAERPDILVTNCGGPPPGDFRAWTQEDWMRAVNANMYTPISLVQGVIDAMIDRRFGRIVNITSAAVKMPIAELGLSNGARSGLTGFMAGLARQVIQHNVTINNLLPGPFLTDRLQGFVQHASAASGVPFDQVMESRRRNIPAGRFGNPEELGDACAYLCGAQAGYITGQNLLMDGGIYPATL